MLMCPRTNELKTIKSDKQQLKQISAKMRENEEVTLWGKKREETARRDHKS